MPKYSGTYATPRLDLGRAMWEYMLGANSLIGVGAPGASILPIFKTMKKAGTFSKITRDSILRSRNVKRAPRTAYSRDEYDAKDQAFSCEERGHEQPLDDSEREMYASDFAAELAASRIAANVVLWEQEKDVASMIFNPTTWTGAALFTDYKATPWSTAATSILTQLLTIIEKVRTNCGLTPNALIIGAGALKNIKLNTEIRGDLKGVVVPSVDQIVASLRSLLGLKYLFVGDMIKNSAKEGQAFVGADVWSNRYAMVARVAESEDLAEPCLGRTMLWSADSPDNSTVEEYREEQTRSAVYRARHNADEVVFDANYAHLIQIEV